MNKCDGCLWSERCRTAKNNCDDYTPIDDSEGLDELIKEGLYEYRRVWSAYTLEYSE